MQLVTFSRAIAGFNAGDKRLLPDPVVAKLEKDAILSSERWPPAGDKPASAPQKPARPALLPRRPQGNNDQRKAK